MTYLTRYKQLYPQYSEGEIIREFCPHFEFDMKIDENQCRAHNCYTCWNREYKGEEIQK